MNEADLFTVILAIGVGIGLVTKFLLGNIAFYWNKIKKNIDSNKAFAKKQAEVKKMKEDGDFHEWISIPTTTTPMLVCKKTGYCPELGGFVSMDIVNSFVERVKREEEYKVFRNARVEKLAEELGFDLEKTEEVVEKVFSMKKDFTLLKLSELQAELTKRASDVREQQQN